MRIAFPFINNNYIIDGECGLRACMFARYRYIPLLLCNMTPTASTRAFTFDIVSVGRYLFCATMAITWEFSL